MATIDITMNDFEKLALEDPEVRIKAINVALTRKVAEGQRQMLSILKQIKSGELSLDRVIVSDDGWQILPEPPPDPGKPSNNQSEAVVPSA